MLYSSVKRKFTIIALTASAALLFGACGIQENINSTVPDSNSVDASSSADTFSGTDSKQAVSQSDREKTETKKDGKSLVIYFDYSENIDISGLDVDTISTASLRGGSTGKNIENLKVMANEAANITNADVFSIQVNETYAPKFEDMTYQAQDDQTNHKQFTFKKELTDLDEYDIVYFGVPVWWGELPQPVNVFFDKYDFSGKTIVPFGIHHGSGFGRMVIQITEYEPDANIFDGFTINADTDNDEVKKSFAEYLNSLKL